MQTLELAKRFITAVEAGDVDTAQACFHPDAGIWHNYDDTVQTVAENMGTLRWMMGKAQKREYKLKRLQEIEGGYLQQHTLRITDNAGEVLTLYACALVSVEDGLITRIEEYIDPSPLASWMSGAAKKTEQ